MKNAMGCVETVLAGTPESLTELVRGEERLLMEQMSPLVRQDCVSLNLAAVQRIDAAGIAALISLSRIARDAGHRFTVCNASTRVAEILTLVGLEGILLTQGTIPASRMELTAA